MTEYYSNCISVIIADNGKGIRLPLEAITKPFITGKSEGGMGMGLNIVSEI
jgi:nitrogen fixation/metabolism regulation signal transduction histidine kinase